MQATVYLFLYLCTDASHLSCQVVPVHQWTNKDAQEQCVKMANTLKSTLSPTNQSLHRFFCETQTVSGPTADHQKELRLTRQSFRI